MGADLPRIHTHTRTIGPWSTQDRLALTPGQLCVCSCVWADVRSLCVGSNSHDSPGSTSDRSRARVDRVSTLGRELFGSPQPSCRGLPHLVARPSRGAPHFLLPPVKSVAPRPTAVARHGLGSSNLPSMSRCTSSRQAECASPPPLRRTLSWSHSLRPLARRRRHRGSMLPLVAAPSIGGVCERSRVLHSAVGHAGRPNVVALQVRARRSQTWVGPGSRRNDGPGPLGMPPRIQALGSTSIGCRPP